MRARPSDFVRRLGTYTGKLSDDPERMAKTKVPALTGRPKRYRLSCDRASPFANILQTRLPSATTRRSEEHTSELQSLMRISYAVFCLKKQKEQLQHTFQPTSLLVISKFIRLTQTSNHNQHIRNY